MLTTGEWPQDLEGNDIEEAVLLEQHSEQRGRGLRPNITGGECRGVAWSSDDQWFAWSCGFGFVRVVRWDGRKNKSLLQNNSGGVEGEIPYVTEIFTGDYVWSIAFGTKRKIAPRKNSAGKGDLIWGGNVVTGGQSSICRKDLSPGEVVLATGQGNGRIRVWDICTGQLKFELCDHTGQIESLHFSTSGPLLLASVSADRSLKVWDLDDSGNLQATIKSQWGFRDCKWRPDSLQLATVGDQKSVCLYDAVSYELQLKLEGHQHNVCRCVYSGDGAVLATCSYDTRVILWDTTTGLQLSQLNHCYPPPSLIYSGGANGMYVRSLAFSPDGLHIATVCDDGYMRVWRTSDHNRPVLVSRVSNALTVQFSTSGTAIAVGNTKGCVSIWKAPLIVSSLQERCRVAIRQSVKDSSLIDNLNTPPVLQRFLRYVKDWRFCEE